MRQQLAPDALANTGTQAAAGFAKKLLMLQLLTPALASSLPAAAIQLAALAVAANKAMLPASCCKLGAAAAYRLLMRLQ